MNYDIKFSKNLLDRLPDPIFILGIKERSGTHFLSGLLRLHPDCDAGGPIWEDYLLTSSGLLTKYVDLLYKNWNPNWKVAETIGPPEFLLSQIGKSLSSFLKMQMLQQIEENHDEKSERAALPCGYCKRLITSTPSVENINNFFKLFPNAHLLILVRDGRAVVESGVRSFNWNYEQAIREWNQSAQTIISFDRAMKGTNHPYLILRYEGLYADTEQQLRRIFSFLELDASVYDFESAKNLPVFGSSDLRHHSRQNLHWDPVQRTASFNPIERWKQWGNPLLERFNWIAGDSLLELGYSLHSPSKKVIKWTIRNTLLDVKWYLSRQLRGLKAIK